MKGAVSFVTTVMVKVVLVVSCSDGSYGGLPVMNWPWCSQ